MKEYMLKIERRELNPAWSPTSQPNQYGGSFKPEEPQFLSTSALEVTVTEEQFNAIRKAALEVM